MKNSNLIAFLGGAIAGGLIALLTAPRSGAETRKIIFDKLKSGAELTKQELEELAEWAKEKINSKEYAAAGEDAEVDETADPETNNI